MKKIKKKVYVVGSIIICICSISCAITVINDKNAYAIENEVLKNTVMIQEENINYTEAQLIDSNNKVEDLLTTIDNKEKEMDRLREDRYDNLSIESMFKIASKTYGVDYNMLYAIARLETGNFTSNLWNERNNPGGIKHSNGYAAYATKQEGITEMARLLKYNYINKGLTTPEEISIKYCPTTASDWANKVNRLMKE